MDFLLEDSRRKSGNEFGDGIDRLSALLERVCRKKAALTATVQK
jgi:hypothetical protein